MNTLLPMTRDQFVSLFFLALLIFVIYQILLIFSPFTQAFFWSAILAFGFYPLHGLIKRKLKSKETLAAIITTAIIFLTVTPPVVFLIVNLTGQAIELYQAVTTYIREGRLENLIDQIQNFYWVQKIQHQIFQWEPVKKNATEWLLNTAKATTNFAASQVGIITKNLFLVILNVVVMTFLTFAFLRDGEKIYSFIYRIAPLEERNKKYISKQINETFAAVLRGQMLTSLTQAVIAGMTFWVLGLPIPIFFGAATFFAALIPVFGASTVWFPLALYLFVMQESVRAVILIVVGFLVISLIDNIMKPVLIGEKTRLPYFMLFFGILGGLKLYGLMGIFIAPVILSLFFTLVKIYQEKYLT